MTQQGNRGPVAVYLEHGRRHVLACAVDWPGWCGYGRSEREALEALKSAAPRYAPIARAADICFPDIPLAGLPLPGIALPRIPGHGSTGASPSSSGRDVSMFEVTERLAGSATADRGAPGLIPACDARPVDGAAGQRCATLLTAAWAAFYRASGGRSVSRLVEHVIHADVASARQLGIRYRRPSIRDATGIVGLREEIMAVIGRPSDGCPAIAKGWPTRYAARRIAWHVIDHIGQIEDGQAARPAAR
jgi:hypothetical protein